MNETASPEIVFKPASILVEGVLWRASESCLYFCDIEKRRLWRFQPLKGTGEIFYHSSRRIGGFSFAPSGSFIVFEENTVIKLYKDGRTETIFLMDFPEGERFNDAAAGPCGRVYAGTMKEGLFLFEKGKTPEKIEGDVNCSNGMGFSPEGSKFYHTVTKKNEINIYDYDSITGKISNKRNFVNFRSNNEWPDGLTVDGEGCLWSAFWTGGVKRISPGGEVIAEITVPASNPTSVAFGGDNMNELFISTASSGIFKIKLPVSGREECTADF